LVFRAITVCGLATLGISVVAAQQVLPARSTVASQQIARAPNNTETTHEPMIPVAAVRMPPEAAFVAYQRRAASQLSSVQEYSAVSVINVELLDTLQEGKFELMRHYVAPRTLEFTCIRFTGDPFVKHNVISRLLQSEVDYMQNQRPDLTAINERNYKVSYKMTGLLEARLVHTYQLKPRKKRSGLFKGRLHLDAFTGELVRSEGEVVKSPSLFVKKIEFVQDYVQVEGLTFLAHAHSVVRTRLIGHVVLDIYNSDYHPVVQPDTFVSREAPHQ
jgi:hypothetical protein